MNLDEATVGIWAFELTPANTGNILASARRLEAQGYYEVEGRLRIYKDDDPNPFTTKDVKHWFKGTIAAENDDGAIIQMRTMIMSMKDAFTNPDHEYFEALACEEGGVPGLLKAMQASPMFNTQEHKIQ